MPSTRKRTPSRARTDSPQSRQPLVFISHHSDDAELAGHFSKLIATCTAGTLHTFRSTDKSTSGGLVYGDDWFNAVLDNLSRASDVVCLLTARSIERPWVLFEAGIGVGKQELHNTKVIGLLLGVEVSTVKSAGPFANFHNCLGDTDSITKLVHQLASRVPCSPDSQIVQAQVAEFLQHAKALAPHTQIARPVSPAQPDPNLIVRLFEEIRTMISTLSAKSPRKGPMLFSQGTIAHLGGCLAIIRDRHPQLADRFQIHVLNPAMYDHDVRPDPDLMELLSAALNDAQLTLAQKNAIHTLKQVTDTAYRHRPS